MYDKYVAIENKRMLYVKRQLDLENMEETSLKKRLMYAEDHKIGKDVWQEERELHEAYQFCIREYEWRHRQRKSSITPERKKKKNKTKSAEVCSMYRGAKSYYEKVAESLPGEEITMPSIIEDKPADLIIKKRED